MLLGLRMRRDGEWPRRGWWLEEKRSCLVSSDVLVAQWHGTTGREKVVVEALCCRGWSWWAREDVEVVVADERGMVGWVP